MTAIVPTLNYRIESVGKDKIMVALLKEGRKEGCGEVVTFPDSNAVFAAYMKNGEERIVKLPVDKKEFFSQCWNYRNNLDKNNRL